MFCSKCGNPLPAGTTFCQNCGTPVSASSGASALPSSAAPVPTHYAAPAPAGTVSPHWLPTPSRTYAGFWLRLVAHIVDGILIGVVMMVLLIPLAIMTGVGAGLRRFHPDDPPDPAMVMAFIGSLWLLILIAVIAGWLYNAYCESSEWQATPGKKILNLVVTDLNGNRVTFGRASGRFFAKMISGIIPFGIGYIMAGFTERKQALHDMIASCLVLRA